jgi:Tfp pilus assembly protein PilX
MNRQIFEMPQQHRRPVAVSNAPACANLPERRDMCPLGQTQGGFVLVIALALSVIVGILVFSSAHLMISSQRIAQNTQNQSEAEQLALNAAVVALDDASAIAQAIDQSSNSNAADWPIQNVTLPGLNGRAKVEISAKRTPVLGNSLNALDRYLVIATSDVTQNGVAREIVISYADVGPAQAQ